MITDVRRFLEGRIKLAKFTRDRLIKDGPPPCISLVRDANKIDGNEVYDKKVAIQVAVVDELVKVANFLDFIPRELTTETKDEEKVPIVSELFFREYFEWLGKNKVPWENLENSLDNEDYNSNTPSDKLLFKTIAVIGKAWYKEIWEKKEKNENPPSN